MMLDVDKSRIANATIEPEERGEIEITPEMIREGAALLQDVYGSLWEEAEMWAKEIYLRMYRAATP